MDQASRPSSVRLLEDGDRGALSAFLDRHVDTSLFLRGNLAQAGLHDRVHPFGGIWAGAFEGVVLQAVAAHFNGGNVVVAGDQAFYGEQNDQGDQGVEGAARLAVAESKRPVRGVVGPWLPARSVLACLDLGHEPSLVSKEVLYRLELGSLRMPSPLEAGHVRCRRSRSDELDALATWRVAFETESLAMKGDARQRAAAFASVERSHVAGRLFVLEDEAGSAVASSAFNAWADGIVQVGGVYTPPALRGLGYGRAVVAGSLVDAMSLGAHRSVLFTGEANRAAQQAYEALGYEAAGDYGLLLF